MKSKIGAAVAAAFAASSLAGCASVVDGRSQEIMVNTNPLGASCELVREGNVIARVAQTPGGVTIEKTKHDIIVKCDKEGYQQATYFNHSGIDEAVFGNLVIGGAVGWGIDSATGSDNKYDGFVNMSLVPSPAAYVSAMPGATSICTHEQQVQARIAKMNGYTGGPKC